VDDFASNANCLIPVIVMKRNRHLFDQDFDLRQQGRLAPFNLP